MDKKNLTLLNGELDAEQRMKNRIEQFIKDLYIGDGDMEHVEQILRAVHDYCAMYEDEDIYFATFEIKKAIFFVAEFNNS